MEDQVEMRSAASVDEVMHEAAAKEVVQGNANGLVSDVAEGQALEEIATIENREGSSSFLFCVFYLLFMFSEVFPLASSVRWWRVCGTVKKSIVKGRHPLFLRCETCVSKMERWLQWSPFMVLHS